MRPEERYTCQMLYESYSHLTPEEIKKIQQRLISKLDQETAT